MVVDTFTKSLPKVKFNFCKENSGVHAITSIKRKLVRIEEVTKLFEETTFEISGS